MISIKRIVTTFFFWAVTVAGCGAGQMSINCSSAEFSVRDVVAYHCVETVDPKFEKLLCDALEEKLLLKGAQAKPSKEGARDGVHIRLSLKKVTDYSISGWMEWSNCKDRNLGSWTKSRLVGVDVMDSVLGRFAYDDFVIGLFTEAKMKRETE